MKDWLSWLPIFFTAVTIVVSCLNWNLSKKNHNLAKENKTLTEIHNNVSMHAFYKEVYESLLAIVELYEADTFALAEDEHFDVDNDSWERHRDGALHSKGERFSNYGLRRDTFNKVEKEIKALAYCWPTNIMRGIHISRREGEKLETYHENYLNSGGNAEPENPSDGYWYDRNKNLLAEVELFMSTIISRKYY
ncbi:hypothetical protein HCJ39_06875 [Listeria rocourtiae]|uniref:hypothetical protein n=1 Tax=Listeria rocourtiae TaxID=647910 RepID=UPI0016254544|nr:hypothetical protein [Listeria rocourtiae]MBC1604433.1 hypothetical protein [Listeria rocourtiae]